MGGIALKTGPAALSSMGKIIGSFLVSRLFIAIFVYHGDVLHPFITTKRAWYSGVFNPWLCPWTLWDSQWYLRIAAHGYESITTAFFPLYPWLLSWAGPSEIRMAVWGVLVSNTCFLFALYFLYRLTSIDFDEKTAERAVFLLAFFPTTAFFSAVYTESLFLLLSVAAFYCVRKQRWPVAGLLAGLAGLTRNSGWILFVMLGIEYTRFLKTARQSPRWLEIFFLSLPLLAFWGVMGYFALEFRSATAGLESQEYYYRSWSWPWEALHSDFNSFWGIFQTLGEALGGSNWRSVFFEISLSAISFFDFFMPFLVLALLIQHRKILPLSYAVYILLIMSIHLFHARFLFPRTAGTLRYLMVTFPFVQLLGRHLGRYEWGPTARIVVVSIYGWLLVVACFAFGYKLFLG